jgi:hypothetical protein
MTAPIEDVSSLPGKRISDQAENPIGKVKEIYATEDGYPMWVAVEMSSGLGGGRMAFIPLARIKDENGELRVPYSKQRIGEAPEIDGEEISAESDRKLRDYYGIDTGDQELRHDNKSYAALVPETAGAASRVEDAGELDTPDADTRTEETRERLNDPGSSEMRKVTAEDIAHSTQEGEDGGRKRDEDGGGKRDEDGGGKREDARGEEDRS